MIAKLLRILGIGLMLTSGLDAVAGPPIPEPEEKPIEWGAKFYSSQDPMPLLTYEEFKRLPRETQIQYIVILQNLARDLAAQGFEVGRWSDGLAWPEKWAFFEMLFFSSSRSLAADSCGDYSFTLKDGGIVCQKNKFGSELCSNRNTSAFDKALSCPQQWNAFVEQKKGDATLSSESRASLDSFNKKVTDEGNKKVEAAMKKLAPTDKPADPSFDVPQKNANAEVKKKLRCIYAGYAVRGENCDPQSKETVQVGGKDKTFSCPGPEGNKKESVLCNPRLFGWGGDDPQGNPKAFCVRRSGKASEQCMAKSKQGGRAALERAADLALNTKDGYSDIHDGLRGLCTQENGKFQANKEVTSYVKDKNDLGRTCGNYDGQLNAIRGVVSGKTDPWSTAEDKSTDGYH